MEELDLLKDSSLLHNLEPFRFAPYQLEVIQPSDTRSGTSDALNEYGAVDDGTTFLRPHPRSGHRVAVDNHYIYVYGGYNPSISPTDPYLLAQTNWRQTNPLFQELWRFSKLTRTWTLLKTTGSQPRELASHCASLINRNTLVVYGGSGVPFGLNSSNMMYLCDLKRLIWSRVQYRNDENDEDLPKATYGNALTIDRKLKRIFVVGGTNGFDYHLEVHAFDWATKTWTQLSATPANIEARYRHEIALWEEQLFIIGGGTSQLTFTLEQIPVFDLKTNSWTVKASKPFMDPETGLPTYPSPRYSHDCAQQGETMYLVGGANDSTVFSDFWSLNLQTLAWTRLPLALPTGLYFLSAGISAEGQLSIFGGVTSVTKKERSNMVYQTWVRVPTLKTLAKMAVRGTLQQINDKREEAMKKKKKKLSTAASQVTVNQIEKVFKTAHIPPEIFNLPVV